MQFTRKGDYALRAMVFMADFKGATPLTIDEIAVKSKVPRYFLAKILKDLTRANLLVAIRGARGGYRLARKASEISMLDIIEATVGPLALNLCVEDSDRCVHTPTCGFHPIWEDANHVLKGIFSRTKLSAVHSK
jgi:Rrf2 family protein